MFCERCGTKLADAQSFCPVCGKAMGRVPLMPTESRIAGHVRLLGILWLAISAVRLIPGVVLLAFVFGDFGFLPPHVSDFVRGLLQIIGVLVLVEGALGLVAGWGLLERRPWARMLTLILGCINLIKLPFGTALGIYTLWVLLPAQSEEEYAQIARAA
jgi:hypothetical protein